MMNRSRPLQLSTLAFVIDRSELVCIGIPRRRQPRRHRENETCDRPAARHRVGISSYRSRSGPGASGADKIRIRPSCRTYA